MAPDTITAFDLYDVFGVVCQVSGLNLVGIFFPFLVSIISKLTCTDLKTIVFEERKDDKPEL